jgi:murein L,D-transpeptidase YafK
VARARPRAWNGALRRTAILALFLAAGCSSVDRTGPAQRVIPARPVIQAQPVSPAQQADWVLVDKSERTLTLFAGGQAFRTYRSIQFGDTPQGHKRFQGDERTPEGRYTIHTRNPNSAYHLSLRISYPNAQDRAYAADRGRSPGGDIFIHGQPNGLRAGRVPGDWTDGCIAVSNAQIEELWVLIADGTPIEIRP